MNELKLIADSGATHTKWCLINGNQTDLFQSQGIAPYLMDEEEIEQIFRTEVINRVDNIRLNEVFFYGTGCKHPDNAEKIKRILYKLFSGKIHVSHDLMGAAHGACGHDAGIVCILGTGSNSCYYDGNEIIKNRPGLGFILGDEGGGAYFGKEVIRHFLYEKMDSALEMSFKEMYAVSPQDILDTVYRKPLPNRYLAGFTKFLEKHRGHRLIEEILFEGLSQFFKTHILNYPESAMLPIHFVGGVAHTFADVIEKICRQNNLKIGSVHPNPMAGLVHYHTKR